MAHQAKSGGSVLAHGGVVVANVPNVAIGGCVRRVESRKSLSNGTFDSCVYVKESR